MVILSASVVTKKGKILLARQYVPMTRLRIEGLLAAFPKLVFSEDNAGSKQHTFVETDEVRYIYQPMDMLYLLLITNMQSNIIEDLGTLRTIAKLIPDYCQGHDESAVEERAFDLIFAIDEVISPGGYREQVNYKQIEDYVKMDSAEAKLTDIIEISKMENARNTAKEKAKQFDEKRKAELRLQGKAGTGFQSRLAAMGVNVNDLASLGGVKDVSSIGGGISSDTYAQMQKDSDPTITEHGNNSKYGNNDSSDDDDNHGYKSKSSKKSSKKKKKSNLSKGLKLESMSKKQDRLFDEQLNADKTLLQTNLLNSDLLTGRGGGSRSGIGSKQDIVEDNGPMDPVEISIIEKLNVLLDRDGVLQKFEVKGDMEVVVNSPEAGSSMFMIDRPTKLSGFGKINWRAHPRMDKNEFESNNILMLKDESKVFKMGRQSKTAVLKWKMSGKNEDILPIKINFWPEADSGEINVNVTYSVEGDDIEMNNVIITLPTPSEPEVGQCDGQYTYYNRENELQWNLGDIKSGEEGEFAYVLEDAEIEDLYPVSVHFEMPKTFLNIQIKQVSNRQSEEDIEYSTKYLCNAENFKIE